MHFGQTTCFNILKNAGKSSKMGKVHKMHEMHKIFIGMNKREYRYHLDKSSKKSFCPNCKKKTYVRYVDSLERIYLPYEFGRCDREIKCGYFNKYKSGHLKDNYWENYRHFSSPLLKPDPSFHTLSMVEESLQFNNSNTLIEYLKTVLGDNKTEEIVNTYKIGTAHNWYNGTIFWQIDDLGKVRSGKIIRYNEKGKRFGKPNWIHSLQLRNKSITEFNLDQCLFGLHLINRNRDKLIAIVESEKTACVMSAIYPKHIWMATGSLNGLNREKLLPIKHREIILYPDSGISEKRETPFEKWNAIATELRLENFDIQISEILEKETTQKQKEQGYDLADFFI